MDEPESMGALSLAAREKLGNLTFIINCNLQRLDGPVRGNGQIIPELESIFNGAGWNVVKDGSFGTDRSGFDSSSEASVPIGDWDLYHVAGGAAFQLGRSELTMGAIVSYGSSTTGRVFEPVGVELSTDDGFNVDYFRLALLVGFNFAFN